MTSLQTDEIQIAERKNRGACIVNYILYTSIFIYSLTTQHAVNFWGGIREPTRKKGELFSELDMPLLPTDEIQNEETKERR